MKKKEFRLFDAVLATVCLILVVEAAAPSAAIGNSQYFWWILLLAAFFLPYGLVSAELGTTYADEGGLFDWIKRAFGRKWGSRVAWYYWINYVFWMASLAVLFTGIIDQAFGIEIPIVLAVLIQLVFIWVVNILSLYSVSENKTLINIGTAIKIILMVSLGLFGIYYGVKNGFANPITSARDLLPDFMGISFIAIILFNFMGFEVVATFSSEMKEPKKEIPKALLTGGILIAVFYIFAAFGIGVAIPVDELTQGAEVSISEGFLESFIYFFDNLGLPGNVLVPIIGIAFLFTLVVNLLSWALGVNYVASYAAESKALPKFFALKGKNDSRLGPALMNGIVASVMIIVAALIPEEYVDDIFWGFFALQIITLLMSYILMFPAFKKLRAIDPDANRPFKVSGGPFIINLFTYLPMVLLILAAFFCMYFPDEDGAWTFDSMLLYGTIAAIIAGEVIAYLTGKKAEG
ncbi:MAG: APC family permease [Treponema sp.]|nr:APC family permease [Treponema sp.]